MTTPWRKLREKVANKFNRYIVAVSGGVDSMVALELVKRSGKDFRVVHVDHSEHASSVTCAEFVRTICEREGYQFHVETLTNAGSNETEWRDARYKVLRDQMVDFGAERIITGHHLNDQVETAILRLMRGVSCTKLGMEEDNGFVFRPLLDVTRESIVKHAETCNIPWIEDVTNLDLTHERNWVRHVILPEMLSRRNVLKTIPLSLKNLK